jgi:uncharacterized membrane protein
MRPLLATLAAAASAAFATYYLDPENGRRRRALVRDKVHSGRTRMQHAARVAAVDARNRARGTVAELRKRIGGGAGRGQKLDLMQENWAPATRFSAGAAGAGLALWSLLRRSAAAPVLFLTGAALLTRAGTNMSFRRLAGGSDRGIRFVKTIRIVAPRELLFALWQDMENFPKFMRNVRRVYRNGDNWHWEVAGPLGTPLEWEAVVTQVLPNQFIAWCTTPGSPVQHAGRVHFQDEGEGTRVQVEMSYNPPAGALGHVVASLFGADPKKEMDEDLLRMKALFETGTLPHDAAEARNITGSTR